MDLSSLLDGELAPTAAAEALEHALGCAACADFFRAARRVQTAAEALRAEDGAMNDSRAEELWSAVEARTAEPRAVARPARVGWTLRAAALVALGLGGGYLLSSLAGPGSPAATLAQAPAVAAAAPGSAAVTAGMDERRFVAVADELLKSDVRYQRAMLEVLKLVPAIETGEGLRAKDEPRIVRASNDGERREAGEI